MLIKFKFFFNSEDSWLGYLGPALQSESWGEEEK
jgi:hypothetical protein